MGRYGEEEEEEEEEGIEIILPEIVPELFTSNEAWIVLCWGDVFFKQLWK